MTWKPNYSGWDSDSDNGEGLEGEPALNQPAEEPAKEPAIETEQADPDSEFVERVKKTLRIPSPTIKDKVSEKAPMDYSKAFVWGQRITIGVLILIIIVLLCRKEFSTPEHARGVTKIDFASMDVAANEARAEVFLEVAGKAGEFKDLQALIDWQDERLRAARLEAYQPWVELLTRELDEDRYDPKIAEQIFRAAAKASRY